MGFFDTNSNSSLNSTPAWWPLGDIGIDQTEREKLARLGSMANVRGYYQDMYGIYNSFSGADIVAYIHIPPQSTAGNDIARPTNQTDAVVGVLGNIQTISYSTFREVIPVRSLGRTYADGYTRGPRTIAGTLIWTVLDQYVLAEALRNSVTDNFDASTILVDQLPPFNVIITFNNEYGDVATMGIYGIRIVNEGATFSIDDMITEQTNTYIAQDIDLLHKGPPFKSMGTLPGITTGTDVLTDMINQRMNSTTGAKHGSSLQ